MAVPVRRGLGWILAANIVLAVDYSMIMPTGWLYIERMGGSEMFYGATIAAYPCGRLCLLMLVGYWSDRKGFRAPFLTANVLGIVGGLTYGFASALGSKWYAMLGRFIGGCGATHPLSAWAARNYPAEERTKIEQMQKSAQLIGVILGPSMNAFIVNVDVKVGAFRLNPETCAGFVPALLSVILVIGFLYGVDEPALEKEKEVASQRGCKPKVKRLMDSGAWACLFIAFYSNFQLSAFDTIFAPLLTTEWGWTLFQTSTSFIGLAFVSFVGALIGIVAARRKVKALTVVKIGSVANFLSVCGMAASLYRAPGTVYMTCFIVCVIFNALSLLAYGGATGGLYQQACGNSQGVLGGLYTMAYAIGRPVGATLGGALLGGNPYPLCILPALCTCIGLIFTSCAAAKLQKSEDEAIARGSLLSVELEQDDNTCS